MEADDESHLGLEQTGVRCSWSHSAPPKWPPKGVLTSWRGINLAGPLAASPSLPCKDFCLQLECRVKRPGGGGGQGARLKAETLVSCFLSSWAAHSL